MELKFNNKLKVSLHNHSFYSRDSEESPSKIIEEAIKQGLEIVGISDHAPLPFPFSVCGMEERKVDQYLKEITALKNKYKDKIKVLLGMAIDYLHFNLDFTRSLINLPLDYTIGSVHFIREKNRIWCFDLSEEEFNGVTEEVFGGEIKKFCKFYFQLIKELVQLNKFDILGHCDLIKKFNKEEKYFSQSEDWYQKLIEEVLDDVVKTRIIVEVNTAGLDRPVAETYPSGWIVKELVRRNIPFLLSGDSHGALLVARHYSDLEKDPYLT